MNHMQSMETDRRRPYRAGRPDAGQHQTGTGFFSAFPLPRKLCRDLEVLFRSRLYLSGLSRIVLFGSCARNEMRAGSDLDLLVLTEETVPQELKGELCGELEETQDGISTDLVFIRKTSFVLRTAAWCRISERRTDPMGGGACIN